jgi:hypothetical protein
MIPRTPLKETEPRKEGWEERHGEGANELDALEALHPGELGRMLVEEIERYYDDDLQDQIDDTESGLTINSMRSMPKFTLGTRRRSKRCAPSTLVWSRKFAQRSKRLRKSFRSNSKNLARNLNPVIMRSSILCTGASTSTQSTGPSRTRATRTTTRCSTRHATTSSKLTATRSTKARRPSASRRPRRKGCASCAVRPSTPPTNVRSAAASNAGGQDGDHE